MTDLTYKDEVVGTIRPATHEDCLIVGNNLRDREAQEIWGYDNSLPVEGVTKSFNKSVVKMTILHDDKPIAMFGIMIEKDIPTLWLMPTNDLEKIGRNFVRNTKEWINKMLEEYPMLTAYVNCMNEESERWMAFVGGKYIRKVFMGKDSAPFWEFKFHRQELSTRENIKDIEVAIGKVPGAMFGDCCPLEHTFVDGAYVRNITMPKGLLVVSKIHKKTHPYFIMKGKVSVLTEEGMVVINAPYAGITKAGTKRVLYCHTDVEWITVHVTDSKDLEEIESQVIAKDFSELTTTEQAFINVFAEVK